jgi:RNA polymerase sigma-70 factor (ECF subfamily)
VDVAEELSRHRGSLVLAAYRMLGSIDEAEDVVQEAFLRAQAAAPAGIESPKAWLLKVVGRLCLDHLRSARVRRESYVGPWLPEPILDSVPAVDDDPADRAALADELSIAFLSVLETLSPAERIVYVLREAFGVPFAEIAGIVGRTPEACRQLAVRARKHVASRAPRFPADLSKHTAVVAAFRAACESGDTDSLAALLDDRVVLRTDGGGVAAAAKRPIEGRRLVVNAVAGLLKSTPEVVLQECRVNGQAGLVATYRGGPAVIALHEEHGLITRIDVIVNPEKLRRTGLPLSEG